jgi:hypothetical protein
MLIQHTDGLTTVSLFLSFSFSHTHSLSLKMYVCLYERLSYCQTIITNTYTHIYRFPPHTHSLAINPNVIHTLCVCLSVCLSVFLSLSHITLLSFSLSFRLFFCLSNHIFSHGCSLDFSFVCLSTVLFSVGCIHLSHSFYFCSSICAFHSRFHFL